jgi:microcystin-dependent protein
MAYIGNAKTPLIFASNTRDDILPELQQNGQWKSEFLLSQEVPGGYESNIMVLARRILSDVLVTNSSDLSIEKIEDVTEPSGYKTLLTTSDPHLAAALNVLLPPISYYEGDTISFASSVAQNNNKKSLILSKTYDGDAIEIVLDNADLVAQTGTALTITRLSYAPWEVLEPEKDYQIVSGDTDGERNRVIDFEVAPKDGDVVYVLHRGEATYNFVPSPKSVGPEQLQENLRDFVCDRYVVTDVGGQTEFDLSREAINSKSLFVTVDGQIADGDDVDIAYDGGTWALSLDRQSIVFKQPIAQNSKVKVLHLGFSTVSRKSNISAGQISIPDRSIKTVHIDFGAIVSNRIANSAVTSTKLADDSVHGPKILLNNAEALRAKNSSGTSRELITLTSDNVLDIKNTDGGVSISGATSVTLKTGANQTNTLTATDAKVGIGTTTPEEMLHISGTAPLIMLTDTTTNADSFVSAISNSGSLTLSADEYNVSANSKLNLRVDGSTAVTVTGDGSVGVGTTTPTQKLDVSGTVKASNVQTPTINGMLVEDLGVPAGAIIMSGSDIAPSGWVLCDGQQYDGSNPTYERLFQAIGQRFGGSGTNFRVPDMQKRFPIGQSSDLSVGLSDNLPVANRTISHNHTGPAHTHAISHTHTIPGHTHAMVTDESTLSVSSETSGYHTTNIGHTHPAGVETNKTNLTHRHDHTHGHVGPFLTAQNGKDHYHTGSTNVGDGAHSHTQSNLSTSYNSTKPYRMRAERGDSTSTSITVESANSAHTHKLTTGYTKNDSFVGAQAYLHDHSFSITDAVRKTTGSPVAADGITAVDLDHNHTLPNIVLPTTNSSSVGYHKHLPNEFTGAIGHAVVTKTTSTAVSQGSTAIPLSNVTNIFVGSTITSAQFPAGTSVVAISGNTITTSAGASATISTGATVTFAAPSGNNTLTTVSQNTTSSGPAVYTESTGNSVSPHLVVNFIIKL